MKSSSRYAIEILDDQAHLKLDHKALTNLARKVLRAEKAPGGALAVWFTDDAGIRKIHRRHLGKNSATDVISFDYPESESGFGPSPIGDVVVSVERAVKVCARYGQTPDREAARYLVHGILHLLGYDDHGVRASKKMTDRQEAHLSAERGPFGKIPAK